MGPHDLDDGAQAGGSRHRPPGEGVGQVANSHGRPRQPRPMTTPSHPVAADHGQGVGRLPDVAVAEHRDRVTAALSSAMARQSAAPE